MAGSIRNLLRLNVGLTNGTLLRNNFLNGIRTLYTEKSLGLNGYESTRLRTRVQFMNVEKTFRDKMKEVCKEEKTMIFTEDLKAMLHLSQKNNEDMELLLTMMQKFHSQNQELRFGTYVFGPVVMRTFYYLDEPHAALAAFQNPELDNFFDQSASYQILMCLLFKHNMFKEIRDVYDLIRKKNVAGKVFGNNCLILVTGACYKENTPESFEYVLNLWKVIQERGFVLTRKAVSFIAATALNQNAAAIALEILPAIRESRYITTRCLKVLGFAYLNKFTEIVPVFRGSLNYDTPHGRKEVYFHDVIETLEKQIQQANIDPEEEICKLLREIKNNEHVIHMQTLDQHLTSPIDITPRVRDRRDQQQQQQQFMGQGMRRNRFNQFGQKPELRDLL